MANAGVLASFLQGIGQRSATHNPLKLYRICMTKPCRPTPIGITDRARHRSQHNQQWSRHVAVVVGTPWRLRTVNSACDDAATLNENLMASSIPCNFCAQRHRQESRYQCIANTIVQLFFSVASVVIVGVARFDRDAHRDEKRRTTRA